MCIYIYIYICIFLSFLNIYIYIYIYISYILSIYFHILNYRSSSACGPCGAGLPEGPSFHAFLRTLILICRVSASFAFEHVSNIYRARS